MFYILYWFIFGIIVGFLAKYFHPGTESAGVFTTLCAGLAGSFFGGFVNYFIFGSLQLKPAGLFMSVICTIVVFSFLRWLSLKNVK